MMLFCSTAGETQPCFLRLKGNAVHFEALRR
jgi:hypothetical protein